jgi:hypothetical protein
MFWEKLLLILIYQVNATGVEILMQIQENHQYTIFIIVKLCFVKFLARCSSTKYFPKI